jgi:proteasome lid subunit RPN8/RPN11
MPTCIEPFTTVYGGERITVPRGEYAVDGHELVLRHPSKYDVSATCGRRGYSSRGGRRHDLSLPMLKHAPNHTITIDEWGWRAIDGHLDGSIESGGVLLGERLNDGSFVIRDASGPNSDERGSYWIHHSLDYYRRFADAHAHEGDALGLWHSHPAGTLEPSDTDLRSWDAASANGGTFLALIVTEPQAVYATRMLVRAWTCSDGIVEPATVRS